MITATKRLSRNGRRKGHVVALCVCIFVTICSSWRNHFDDVTAHAAFVVSLPTMTPLPAEQVQQGRRPTVYVDLIGGLGNQLWIWLSSQGIAERNSATMAYSDTSIQMLDSVFQLNRSFHFQLVNSITENKSLPVHHWRETTFDGYEDIEIHGDTHTHLHAYLQNPKYVANSSNLFAQTVASKLHFQPAILQEAKDFLHRMGTCSPTRGQQRQQQSQRVVQTWVGVHVRRFPDRHKIEPLPSSEMIVQQIQTVMSRHCETNESRHANNSSTMVTCDEANPRQLAPCCALVFSNDPPWVRNHIRPEQQFCVQYVDNEFLQDPAFGKRRIKTRPRQDGWATHYGRDMASLSMCDHLIITVGTYGFFAGLLHQQQHQKNDFNQRSTSQRTVYVYSGSHAVEKGFVPTFWEHWPLQRNVSHT
jgi:hypothetical protein